MDAATPDGPGGSDHDTAHVLAEALARHGSLRFDRFVELALYHPEVGFYARHGRAGASGGDFLTSPEVGPLFSVLVARALDRWWHELGRPDPFVVVDAGAGPGTLAVGVRRAEPECASALTWVLVERSDAQRAGHAERLELTEPWHALPPHDEDDEQQRPGGGPRWVSLAEAPAERFTGIVLANELLDNLPFRLLERAEHGWDELYVVATESGSSAPLAEHPVALAEDDPANLLATQLAPDAPVGARFPVQQVAGRWLHDALAHLDRGRVVVFDYADRSESLARRPWTDWLRTYRQHQRGQHPLLAPGSQDITCEVVIDQLVRVAAPAQVCTQAEFLAGLGIDELVEEGRAYWHAHAHVADLAALEARSRVREAEALCDPEGLGAFTVLEWIVTR